MIIGRFCRNRCLGRRLCLAGSFDGAADACISEYHYKCNYNVIVNVNHPVHGFHGTAGIL